MIGKRFVELEMISASQPRSYADHVYEGYLTFSVPEGQSWASKFPSRLEEVIPYAKLMICNWVDKPAWFEARLQKLEKVDGPENKWHIIVTSPYLD